MQNISSIEKARYAIQAQIDNTKTFSERNKLGQFSTPPQLTTDILYQTKQLLDIEQPIRFLDPAFGTGAFYSALLQALPLTQIVKAQGFEIDPNYGLEAIRLWEKTPLELEIADFTQVVPPTHNQYRANLLICNPPYVRHHHIDSNEKIRLKQLCEEIVGLKLNGLSGLYCYFLFLSHAWLADDAIGVWLIPSEFMDVNYGKIIKDYFLRHVTLLHIHRYDPTNVQFKDALISSAIIWFRKTPPPPHHSVKFTFGNSLITPRISKVIPIDDLNPEAKWSHFFTQIQKKTIRKHAIKLSDLFTIKRGLATGANKFFILDTAQINEYQLPMDFLRPILPSPRYVQTNEIIGNESGIPQIDRQLFLLDCDLPEEDIKLRFFSLWEYLKIGKQSQIHERYLCRSRTPWYSQEKRPPPPLLCTYMGRNNNKNVPFRFIYNQSLATATNVYLLLYPKPILENTIQESPKLIRFVWECLNSISIDDLIAEGRVYGGGLYKIEPKELGNVLIENIYPLF